MSGVAVPETHRLLHYVDADAARELGHLVVAATGPGDGQPPFGGQGRQQPDGDGG